MFLLEVGPVIFSGAEGIITFIRSHIQIALCKVAVVVLVLCSLYISFLYIVE